MRLSRLASRAALLGFVGVAACDVYAIATDPFPGLVQTWNLPIAETRISVASLLPAGVTIFSTPASNPPDSAAFQVSMPAINYSRPLAPNCPACQAISGTTAPKPAFNIGPGNSSASRLPANVDSATILGATVTYTITNGFSFDPIRVNPSNPTGLPQGRIDIMIRSGSVVLTRDSLKGQTATLAAGTAVTRTLPLPSNKVGDSITVDLLVDSPAGEPVFMDASRSITASATINNLQVADVKIRVPSASLSSGTPEEVPISDLDESFTERAISGGLELNITNPFAVAGNMSVNLATSSGPISKTAAIAAVTTPQRVTVTFDSLEMVRILTSNPAPTLAIGGAVAAPAPITVTPRQVIQMSNRLILKIRAFGGTD
jgi:hypothetical protein